MGTAFECCWFKILEQSSTTYTRIDSSIVGQELDLAFQDPFSFVPHLVPAFLVGDVELDEVDAGKWKSRLNQEV